MEIGSTRGFNRLVSKLEEHFGIRRCNVMVRPLGNAAAPRKSAALSYRLLSSQEVLEFARDQALHMSDDFAKSALRRGDVCVGAFNSEEMVGYAWLAFAAAPLQDGVWVTLDPRACYSYKTFVKPAWREMDIERTLAIVADDLCIWSGKTFAMHFIDSNNAHSIAEAQRQGAETVAHAAFMQKTGTHWSMRSPGAERFEFAFYKSEAEEEGPAQPAAAPAQASGVEA